MKKRWIALIVIASLAIGAVGASCFWLNFNAQFMSHGNAVRAEADIVSKVAVLEHLRAGRVADATNILETLLDGDLISAAAFVRDGIRYHASTVEAVALEMKARIKSGYTPTDENVRDAVQDAFRLISTSSKGSVGQSIIQPDLSRKDAPDN